ncbi:endonuclease/exonuclease/phosphatase family protein [Salipiger sp. PrR002]|uniref:endonuclease/exonuclease/phosphatase family protein n=1 Tax=Salipiger sp. PrR002 TaxID=2706489 RepID=UPI0013B7DFE8|nr:endonuclease/exonuclease/phosphatase family protein [Salipiger sp. PrR002]NDV98917.1 endonuclease [Salipiger sp. PrR002]NDW55654.1 endonuclease [Salipiger sp. PrR004]
MRLATYNVEWFDDLFSKRGELLIDDHWSGRRDVTRAQQAEALGMVFTAMDADAVMIIEAPDTGIRRDTRRALHSFAEAFDLRAREVLVGFVNDTQQEIALLYDPDVLTARHVPGHSADAPRFNGTAQIDLGIGDGEEAVIFSKPPLEVELTMAGGRSLRLLGAHLKSKAPHGAQGAAEVRRLAIANRRKQLAQAIWLRRRVDALLQDGESVVVLGDLNDGPGVDEYEHVFGRSSVEVILGDGETALYDPHASEALRGKLTPQPTTARFYIEPEKRYLQALLDYIMVSQDLREVAQGWRIWHPFEDARCWQAPDLCSALLAASDHFPVTLDLAI